MKTYSNNLGVLDDKFILTNLIGTGASADVYKAIDNTTGKEYAIKLFNKSQYFKDEIKFNEIIRKTGNQSFIKYIDSSNGTLVRNETSTQKNYIIFELASKGDLVNYIYCNDMELDEKFYKIIFYEIIKAVEFLHSKGISHRDLKIDNLLVDGDDFKIKISDLGLSSFIFNEKKEKIMLKGKVGSPFYAAPEILMKKPYDGEKIDIFSLGVLLFSMVVGSFGFPSAQINNKLYRAIKENKIDHYWDLLAENKRVSKLSEDFKDLYIKMVSFDPNKRPTIEEILKHDWMKEITSLKEEELKALEKELIKEFQKREKIITNC